MLKCDECGELIADLQQVGAIHATCRQGGRWHIWYEGRADPTPAPHLPAVLFCGPGSLYLARTPRPGDTWTQYQMVARNSQFQVTFSLPNEYLSRMAQRRAAYLYGSAYLISAYADTLRDEWRARQHDDHTRKSA